MPKIAAATVAEHRSNQRAAVLAAAVDLLAEGGVSSLTPGSVGSRAGMARSSVYQYFGSVPALLASLLEESFPPARAVIDDALTEARTPAGRVEAYVRATLRMTTDDRHRALPVLARADLPAMCRSRMHELQAVHAEPLLGALAELDPDTATLRSHLILGLLQAAMRRVEAGDDVADVERNVLVMLRVGVLG